MRSLVAYLGRTGFPCSLSQRVHDHWPGHRCGWTGEQGSEALLDPREPASIGLLCARVIVEDADRRHRVVRCIDHIVGLEPGTSLMIGIAPSLILRANSS